MNVYKPFDGDQYHKMTCEKKNQESKIKFHCRGLQFPTFSDLLCVKPGNWLHVIYMAVFLHRASQLRVQPQTECLSMLTKCWQVLSFAYGKSLTLNLNENL